MARVSHDFDGQFQTAVQTLREVFARRNQELLAELSASKQTIQHQQQEAMAKDQEIDTLLGRISELELVVKERNGDIQSLTQQRSALQAEVTSWKAQTEQLAEFKHAISALVDPTGHSSPLPRSTLPRVRSRGIQSLTAMLDDSDLAQ